MERMTGLSLHAMRYLIILSILIFTIGCSAEQDECASAPDIAESNVEIEIERLEDELFATGSIEEVSDFLKKYPVVTREFFGSEFYPADSILARELFNRINNPYLDTLLLNTKAYFGDLRDLKLAFEQAFGYLKYYYPGFTPPKIQTLVTGFGSSEMFVSDSLIVIGLDFYLGPTAKYRPPNIPAYILERYEQSYIVPAVMLLFANRYIAEERGDNTMLADMIYYGKKYQFAKSMLPCVADSLIVWYSGEILTNVEANKDVLWFYFLNNELLFETNHLTKQKFMDERPFVAEIGDKCPGRIGAWIGWDIIRAYLRENPDISLQQLMAEPDARTIFKSAKYRGGT